MKILNNEFENIKIDYNKLIDYGFILKDNIFIYEKSILDNKFRVIIEVKEGLITSKLIDTTYNEEYILVDLEETSGKYVGKVKDEYTNVIKNIINKCTVREVFKNKQTNDIIKYIKEKYDDELE